MSISRFINTFAASLLVFVACLVASACQRTPAAPVGHTPGYMPTATIKELMLSVIDPSADVVWNSVMAVVGPQGLVETKPRSEEEWTQVRNGAMTLMEAANLLMVPGRHVAKPGEKSETPGIELEPEEMDVLIANDRVAWDGRAKALHDIVAKVIDAIDARNPDKVFELGADIEVACETCHKQYWYPNEKIPELPSEAAK
jgi:hypothetical protein